MGVFGEHAKKKPGVFLFFNFFDFAAFELCRPFTNQAVLLSAPINSIGCSAILNRHAPDNKCGAGKEMSLQMYAFVPEEGWRYGEGREFGCTLVVLNSFILACLEVGLITDERTSQTFVRVSWLER